MLDFISTIVRNELNMMTGDETICCSLHARDINCPPSISFCRINFVAYSACVFVLHLLLYDHVDRN